jgi:hypothetical protein
VPKEALLYGYEHNDYYIILNYLHCPWPALENNLKKKHLKDHRIRHSFSHPKVEEWWLFFFLNDSILTRSEYSLSDLRIQNTEQLLTSHTK